MLSIAIFNMETSELGNSTLHSYLAVVFLHLGALAMGELSSEQHRDSEDWRHQDLGLRSYCLSGQNDIKRVGEVEKSAIKLYPARWCGSNTTAARPQQEQGQEMQQLWEEQRGRSCPTELGKPRSRRVLAVLSRWLDSSEPGQSLLQRRDEGSSASWGALPSKGGCGQRGEEDPQSLFLKWENPPTFCVQYQSLLV